MKPRRGCPQAAYAGSQAVHTGAGVVDIDTVVRDVSFRETMIFKSAKAQFMLLGRFVCRSVNLSVCLRAKLK